LALEAAARAGAQVEHLERMWNYAAGVHHPRPSWEDHGVSLIPPKSALWVDASGRRIMEPLVSGFDTNDLVRRIAASPHGYSWQILNRKIALKELAASGADWNAALRERKIVGFAREMVLGNRALVDDLSANCPDVVTGRSVDELVLRMNAMGNPVAVDRDVLEAEIVAFDNTLGRRNRSAKVDLQRKMIETLRQWRGDRMRLVKRQRILNPTSLPLIAIREFVVTRKSLGGIVTDLESRAVTAGGDAIPGLYAVGEAAGFGGGSSHGHRALEGTFLLSCVITGRRAAKSIVNGRA
jgi:predicted oxidoreductase